MSVFAFKGKTQYNRAGADNMKAPLNMAEHKIKRVADGTDDGDGMAVGQTMGGDMQCGAPNPMVAPATEIVNQTTTDSTSGLRTGATTNVKIAQLVTSGLRNTSKCVFKLTKEGSPSGTVWAELYSDSSSVPNTLLATSSEKYNCAEITTAADFTFSFPKYSLCPSSATAKQHIVLAGDYAASATDYIKASINTAGTGLSTYNGTAWATSSSADAMYHYAYWGDNIL